MTGYPRGSRPSPRNLILSEQPVARLRLLGRPSLRPGVAAVYATADGTAECSGSTAMLGNYHTVYEVDTSRHQCSFTTTRDPLPASDDRHFFNACGTVVWHVAKPAIVVEKGIRDGERMVLQRVLGLMRLISRRFDSTECELVEREINQLTANGGIEHRNSGLFIDDISAEVTLDRTPVTRQRGLLMTVSGAQPAPTWPAARQPASAGEPGPQRESGWRPRRHRAVTPETTEASRRPPALDR